MARDNWRRWPRYTRDLPGAWLAIEDLRDAVDSLLESDRIAEAIAEKTAEKSAQRMTKGTYTLTKRQTWCAIAGVVLAAGALIADTAARLASG